MTDVSSDRWLYVHMNENVAERMTKGKKAKRKETKPKETINQKGHTYREKKLK